MRRGVFLFGLAACGGAAPAVAVVVPPPQPSGLAPTAARAPLSPPVASVPTIAPVSPSPSSAGPPCPSDMVALPGVCIDRFEAPNVAGAAPLAFETAIDGERWCAERDKRLCTEHEWIRACEGTAGRRFPYGDEHRPGACNDGRTWVPVRWKVLAAWPAPSAAEEAARLYQADASGAHPGCVSEEGVFDLVGNVAEWVRRSDPPPRAGYDHVLKGCYWAGCYQQAQPTCTFRNSAHPGSFRTYEAGFRCCRDSKIPDHVPHDLAPSGESG